MPLLRTRFKNDIVAEFLPPARPTKKKKVIVMCEGMPTVPSKSSLVKFLSSKGFWVFYPRYRGSWESGGTFLKRSPEKDLIDVIDELPKGFVSMWDGKKYKVRPDQLFVIAGSFGGPAGILASRDPRIKKVFLVSSVVDWLAPSDAEPLDWLETFVRRAFGNGYRFGKKEWAKLGTGKFYNPCRHEKEIDGEKLFFFHAKDDDSVRWNDVALFARNTGARLELLKKGGHLRMGEVVPKHWKDIGRFLR